MRLKVWVRSGGRCVLCNRYMLEGSLTGREVTFGELAHMVGQQPNASSPRGLADLDDEARDDPDNLMLVCEDEHRELDKLATRDLFSVDFLRDLKRRHEERIRHVTDFREDQSTVILRMIGRLRGSAIEVDRDAAAAAVINSGGRFPRFDLAWDRHSIEIDLRHVPGESVGDHSYYEEALRKIDDVIDHKLADGLERGDIRHLSVFAFGRLPLLVHLGARLDDSIPTDVYQRHRTHTWTWSEGDPPHYELVLPQAAGSSSEGVLVLNLSGSIQPNELPPELNGLPSFQITVTSEAPHPGVIASPAALGAFERQTRELLAEIEARHKGIRRLHTFLAVPLSAAVTLGQVHDPAVHPALILHDRADNGYRPVHEIGIA